MTGYLDEVRTQIMKYQWLPLSLSLSLFARILIIYNCIIRKVPDMTRVLKELPTRGDAVDKGSLYEN